MHQDILTRLTPLQRTHHALVQKIIIHVDKRYREEQVHSSIKKKIQRRLKESLPIERYTRAIITTKKIWFGTPVSSQEDDILKKFTKSVGLILVFGHCIKVKYTKDKLQSDCIKGFFFFVFFLICEITYNISSKEVSRDCEATSLRDDQSEVEKCIKVCSATSSLFLNEVKH